MDINMGYLDRVIRIIIAVVIGTLSIMGKIHGVWNIILDVLAVLLLLTGLFGFCVLYVPCRINTNKKKAA